ncbi:MAG: hypothetical protein J3R72DRAFT_432638 [Linnemannia gamsii]|nr:MAG: hypothetical protein J3R72DRAFT_432638 [Linnemannia gamsii]
MQRPKVCLRLLLLITFVVQLSLALRFGSSVGAGDEQDPAHQKQQWQHSLTIVSQPPRNSSSDATVATIINEDSNATSATIVLAEPEARDYVPPSYYRLRRLRGTRPRPRPPSCKVRRNRSWFPQAANAFPFHEFPVQGAEAERLRAALKVYDEDRKQKERFDQIMAKILNITIEELRVMRKEGYDNEDDHVCVTGLIFMQEDAKRMREILRRRWQHQVLSNVCKPEDEYFLEYENGNEFPWRDDDYAGHEEQ